LDEYGSLSELEANRCVPLHAPGLPQPSWALGDFDYNGFVDDDDVTLLGAFYDPSAPPLNSQAVPGVIAPAGVVAVPEPSTAVSALLVLVFAAVTRLLVCRRRLSRLSIAMADPGLVPPIG
jgi:hypothetical protein